MMEVLFSNFFIALLKITIKVEIVAYLQSGEDRTLPPTLFVLYCFIGALHTLNSIQCPRVQLEKQNLKN